jgi:hypothetical protein
MRLCTYDVTTFLAAYSIQLMSQRRLSCTISYLSCVVPTSAFYSETNALFTLYFPLFSITHHMVIIGGNFDADVSLGISVDFSCNAFVDFAFHSQ